MGTVDVLYANGRSFLKRTLLANLTSQQVLTVNDSQIVEIGEKSLESTDDMCALDELHESLILHNLRQRMNEDSIYVRVWWISLTMIDLHRTYDRLGEPI